MKDQLRLVFELDQLDLKIAEIRERLEKIPQRRGERESELEERRQALQVRSNEIDGLEKGRRDKEGEVSLAEARLREFQGKLSQIKTNKEYQAATKGVSETKKSNKLLEDQILELMTKIEALKKERDGLGQAAKDQEEGLRREMTDLEVEEKRLQATALEVEQERSKIVPLLGAPILSQYQRIKRMRRDAVTFVEEGTCQGCHMHIQPQLIIEIQKLKSVHACPSCHRILYLREWREAPKVQEATP